MANSNLSTSRPPTGTNRLRSALDNEGDVSPDHSIAAMSAEIAPSPTDEAERDVAYRGELLRIARQRFHLLSTLMLLMLPMFALLHALLSPQTRYAVGLTHLILLGGCLVTRALSRRLCDLGEARRLGLATYALFACGAAIVGALVSRPGSDSSLLNQFIVYSSFSQILLSVLLLPVSVFECAAVVSIVLPMMAFSSLGGANGQHGPFFWSHFFVVATTSFVVLVLAHYGHLQRRGAFDATFDAARVALQLERLSLLDAVTGGFNRRHLENTLATEIHRAARFRHPLSLLMFDLDDFKAVNDTQGHSSGDQTLAQVHLAAQKIVRDVDTVTRFGGDEFVIILPETESEAALQIAGRLQSDIPRHLKAHFGDTHPAARVTLSLGLVTAAPNDIADAASLLQRVDERLYNAKHGGKNRISL